MGAFSRQEADAFRLYAKGLMFWVLASLNLNSADSDDDEMDEDEEDSYGFGGDPVLLPDLFSVRTSIVEEFELH